MSRAKMRGIGVLRSVVLMSALVLGVTGCCSSLTKGPPLGDPVKLGEGIATTLTTADVSRLIDQRTAQFQSLTGWGKIGIQNWQERYRFAEAFVLEKPGRFRLETLGALDQPALFLTSNERILSLYSKKQNKFYTGVASQENLFKLSSLNFSVDDTILVLSGNPPELSQISAEWGMPITPEVYFLERTSLQDETIQRIWFDTSIQAISKVQEYMLRNGILVADIDFKDYRAGEGGYPIPAYILIDRPFDKTRVEIKYTSVTLNQPIEQSIFTFVPPQNAQTYMLDTLDEQALQGIAPYEDFRVND